VAGDCHCQAETSLLVTCHPMRTGREGVKICALDATVSIDERVRQESAIAEVNDVLSRRADDAGRLAGGEPVVGDRHNESLTQTQ
jgi:hypothetical protein